MERKLLCQIFTATNCSTLARHALKLICQTTLIQFCSSRYSVCDLCDVTTRQLVVAHNKLSCCDVTEVT